METANNSTSSFEGNNTSEILFENPLHVGYIRNLFIATFTIVCAVCVVGKYFFLQYIKLHTNCSTHNCSTHFHIDGKLVL